MENSFAAEYTRCLRRFIEEGREEQLAQSYELGRRALGEKIGLLKMVEIHQDYLRTCAEERQEPALAEIISRADSFLLEGLSSFEIAQRSFQETNLQLRGVIASLEKRNAELAEAHRQLEEARKTLEDRVLSRTEELREANLQLEKEFRIRLEAERRQSEAIQLMEKAARLSSIGVIAGGITHEISQPLNAIKLTADSILFWNKRNPKALPKNFLDKIEKISKGAAKIDEIIQHMRSFCKFPSGKSEEQIDLRQIVDNALALVERQLHLHGIKPQIEAPSEPVLIHAHAIRLEQIVINLVVNAMHAIDSTQKPVKELRIVIKREKDAAVLEVIDNGTGLPDGTTSFQLFDPFYSTKKTGQGTGLGLAIVRGFVDSLRGSINAHNNEQGGATFQVFLPLE